jgi:hypothetical protein
VLGNVAEQAGRDVNSVEDCPVKILRSWRGTLEKKKAAAAAAGVARPLDAPIVGKGPKASAEAAGPLEKPETAKKRQAAAKDQINKAAAIEAIEKALSELYGARADDVRSDAVAAIAQVHDQPFASLEDCPTKDLEEWAGRLAESAAKRTAGGSAAK